MGERLASVFDVIKKMRLQYYGHQTRKQAMAKMLIEGRVEGNRG